MNNKNADHYFLRGGGEMGELTRAKDWRKTSLGEPATWPQSLRTTLGILLSSKFPMFLWWGPELLCFYNDAYRPSLGKEGKHPSILGMPAKDAWTEIWEIIKPLIDKVVNEGESIWFEDMLVPIYRNGNIEDVYWTFSYSPVSGDTDKVSGVLVTCVETTEKVYALKKVEESDKRFRNTMKQAPVGITILRGPEYIVEMANATYLQLVDREEATFVGKPLFHSLPEAKDTVESLLNNVSNTGIPFHGYEVPVSINRQGKLDTFYFDFLYHPLRDEDETISGIIVTVTEVTEKIEARKKIEQNSERLNIVVEASELGTYELNMKTKEPTYSKRYLEILGGYKEDIQLTHAQLLDHLHPDDFSIREKALKDAIDTGYLHYEARLIWNDKSIHWMEGRGKVFYDEDGNPEKLIGTIRDITEERNHEQELKKSEEQFSTLADNMENLAWLADGEGWIYWYNKRWLEYTGLSLEEMQGWGWQKVHHPDHVERIVETSKKIWHINKSFELTFPLRRYDGEYRWFLTRGHPVVNREGTIIKWIGTNTDITEQKKAEEQFKVLADQAPMWVWLTDKEVNVIYCNPEVLNFLGLAHYTELNGTIWEQNIHPEEISMVYQAFGEAVSLQKSFSFECRVINASTRQYEWFYIKAVPRLEAGEITGFIGTGLNINEQKTFAKELELQVSDRTKELETSNTELEKMNRELQSFAYISSHDLQEPLRKIQTFASRIKEKEEANLTDSGKEMFNRMQEAANRMQSLIQDLLAYSRTTTTEQKTVTINLNEIIAEVKEDLREELIEKSATIDATQLCEVNIIPFQFRQLMHNLIGNSLKFSIAENPPHIKISSEIAKGIKFKNEKLSPQKKYCHISVSDNGIGFDPQYSEKIFEVFQRLHGKNEYKGTGIGLSIVKKIVENHSGFITATSVPNQGATFEIYIPAK